VIRPVGRSTIDSVVADRDRTATDGQGVDDRAGGGVDDRRGAWIGAGVGPFVVRHVYPSVIRGDDPGGVVAEPESCP
jgi:hypothetical protein